MHKPPPCSPLWAWAGDPTRTGGGVVGNTQHRYRYARGFNYSTGYRDLSHSRIGISYIRSRGKVPCTWFFAFSLFSIVGNCTVGASGWPQPGMFSILPPQYNPDPQHSLNPNPSHRGHDLRHTQTHTLRLESQKRVDLFFPSETAVRLRTTVPFLSGTVHKFSLTQCKTLPIIKVRDKARLTQLKGQLASSATSSPT